MARACVEAGTDVERPAEGDAGPLGGVLLGDRRPGVDAGLRESGLDPAAEARPAWARRPARAGRRGARRRRRRAPRASFWISARRPRQESGVRRCASSLGHAPGRRGRGALPWSHVEEAPWLVGCAGLPSTFTGRPSALATSSPVA